jgi:hypothetical protein
MKQQSIAIAAVTRMAIRSSEAIDMVTIRRSSSLRGVAVWFLLPCGMGWKLWKFFPLIVLSLHLRESCCFKIQSPLSPLLLFPQSTPSHRSSSFISSKPSQIKYFKPIQRNQNNFSSKKVIKTMTTAKKSFEPNSILSFLLEKLQSVPPATRLHLMLSIFCTLFHMLGLPAAQLFSLEISRPLEIWRVITSMTYFGPPSLYMANSLWFMIRYGQSLESEVGSANHLWFLILQTLSLSLLGVAVGYKYQARSLLAAVVYASSQLRPTEKMSV